MRYRVTFGASPAAIGPSVDLDAALADACRQISMNQVDVAIHDGNGRSIRGEELAACCRGEKKLTADLLAE
ncbi:MAG TPA: hypothetical protein VHU87_08795 [Rhizomicrobium sp.]|jgi:hypothetical protein|nr:hypothetical protein [Rhizomicrobium sp.]